MDENSVAATVRQALLASKFDSSIKYVILSPQLYPEASAFQAAPQSWQPQTEASLNVRDMTFILDDLTAWKQRERRKKRRTIVVFRKIPKEWNFYCICSTPPMLSLFLLSNQVTFMKLEENNSAHPLSH